MKNRTQQVEDILMRHAQVEDAKQIVEFYNRVGGETDYLSFGAGEYPKTAEGVAQEIRQMKDLLGTCMLILFDGPTIVGIGTIDTSQKRRFQHVGTLGIVIAQSHIGKGLGHKLMRALLDWSKANKVTKKITLVTRADNQPAIALYEKLGFMVEGVFQKDSYDGENYYDSLSMALFL